MSQLLTGNSALGVRDLAENNREVPEGSAGTSDINANFRSELSANVVFTFSWQSTMFLYFFTHWDAHELPAGIHPLSKVYVERENFSPTHPI